MPRKTPTQFADLDTSDDTVDYSPENSPAVVSESIVNARVKGTWLMFWGDRSYDFKDGQRYRIPRDLFNYLKKNGNIYDTMA